MELRKLGSLNKKGDVTDPIIFIILAGILGISLLVLVFTGRTVTDALEGTPLNDSSVSPAVFKGLNAMHTRTIQISYAAFIAFFVIGILLSAFLAGEHPTFIFLFFIFSLVGILLAVMFANVYGGFLDSPTFATVIEDQKVFDFTFRNMPKIFVATSLFGMIVMLSRIFGAPQGRSNPF